MGYFVSGRQGRLKIDSRSMFIQFTVVLIALISIPINSFGQEASRTQQTWAQDYADHIEIETEHLNADEEGSVLDQAMAPPEEDIEINEQLEAVIVPPSPELN